MGSDIGKIYKLVNSSTSQIYIGSTFQTLQKRLGQHKAKSNTSTSKIMAAIPNTKIELVEEIKGISKEELFKKEGEYKRKFETVCVNKYTAGRTHDEWIAENPQKMEEYRRKKNENNKERTVLYGNNKEVKNQKASEYSKRHYLENKEKITEQHKQYKLKIADKYFVCECGGKCKWNDKARHLKGLNHREYMEKNKC